MSRRRTNASGFSKLPTSEPVGHCETDGFTEEQFRAPPRKFPWKAVIFIISLMLVGATCLGFGILISLGYFDTKYEDRAMPLFILGTLMLIPGGYYSYILLCILLKRGGYTFDNIPIF